jgi:hypothetical protein
MKNNTKNQVYVILSVDTEHDIIGEFTTKSAGWTKGLPLLFKVFDALELKSKVCWLIEYDSRFGFVAANTKSDFYVKEFPELITQIKTRGDELGIHPGMDGWLGGEKQIPLSLYNKPELWDTTSRLNNPDFVMKLISSATKEFRDICGVNPVGCRTAALQYATHLSAALAENGVKIDSSVYKGLKWVLKPPNAYYTAGDDIRCQGAQNNNILEIPTTGYINNNRFKSPLRLRNWFLLHWQKPMFLSFYIHNWQAVTPDGNPDQNFLGFLFTTLRFLRENGAKFVSWTEASETYKYLYKI